MCLIVLGCQEFANTYPRAFALIAHPYSVGVLLLGTCFFFLCEMFYVVPAIFGTDGVMYKLCWLLGAFIVYNILGNELACYLTDTSVRSLPEERRTPKPEEEHLWTYCPECEMKVPPRAWHCKWCQCCALRRDHHCIFTATCIGHNNYRYFFWLNFYLALGTGLSFLSHILAFLINKDYRDRSFVMWILRYLMGKDQVDTSYELLWQNWLFMLTNYAFAFPLLMLIYQLMVLVYNTTFYTGSDLRYNLGLQRNAKLLLGKRAPWTFISPSIPSPLPHDGSRWELVQILRSWRSVVVFKRK